MEKTVVSIETNRFKLTLVQRYNEYIIIRESEVSQSKSAPMKDLKLALGVFDDYYNELNNALH